MKKYISVLAVLLLGILLFETANSSIRLEKQKKVQETSKAVPEGTQEAELYAGSSRWLRQTLTERQKSSLKEVFTIEEQEVYTFLQGPRAWEEGIEWAGEWCQLGVKGNSFGSFGCGLCCMANIYNTLSEYEISPWDMCEYAMEVSGYYPTRKAGAIDWGNMKETLKAAGVSCDLFYKPHTYEEFQQHMMKVKSAIVLVSSSEDDTYWKNTPGHYVNIWLYEKDCDTVFLAEPGSPENNRSRIPLRYIYDALKTASKFQYLAAEEYDRENNQWKENGIDENWNHSQ